MKRIYNEICSKNADEPYWEDRIEDIVKFVGSSKKSIGHWMWLRTNFIHFEK